MPSLRGILCTPSSIPGCQEYNERVNATPYLHIIIRMRFRVLQDWTRIVSDWPHFEPSSQNDWTWGKAGQSMVAIASRPGWTRESRHGWVSDAVA